MNLLIALAVGVLTYFVAHLVFNEPISFLLGVVAGLLTFFGDRHYRNRL